MTTRTVRPTNLSPDQQSVVRRHRGAIFNIICAAGDETWTFRTRSGTLYVVDAETGFLHRAVTGIAADLGHIDTIDGAIALVNTSYGWVVGAFRDSGEYRIITSPVVAFAQSVDGWVRFGLEGDGVDRPTEYGLDAYVAHRLRAWA